MRMRGALCLSPLRFSSKFQLRPLVVVGVFNFTDGRKGTPGPIKLLHRSPPTLSFEPAISSSAHAAKKQRRCPRYEHQLTPSSSPLAARPRRRRVVYPSTRGRGSGAPMEMVLVISLPLVALVIIVAIILCIICR